jgi:LL-diaminopimelate aminotransferase
MSLRLSAKLDRLPPYLFSRIDEARLRAEARGLDTVSLGIGDPDRDPPEWIRGLLAEEVMRGGNHRYPAYKGHPALHDAALRFLARRYGLTGLGRKHVMTTIGSKESLVNLVHVLLDPGDVLLHPDPLYPVFATVGQLFGAEALGLPVHPTTDFLPDPREHLTPEQLARVKVLYINYPHNPTGQTATLEYLQWLVDCAREFNWVIVSDAAYNELYYPERDGTVTPSPSVLQCEGGLDCAVELHSFSKSYNMTGWRCGFAVGNPALIAGLHTMKSNVDSGVFNAIQLAMSRALDDVRCDPFLQENREHYGGRLARACHALDEMEIRYHRPGGSIFIWCELPDNAEKHADGSPDSLAWCARLLDERGVIVSPGAGYGRWGEGFFRLSLSTPDDRLKLALERLAEFVAA